MDLLNAMMEGARKYFDDALTPMRAKLATVLQRLDVVESSTLALSEKAQGAQGPPGPQGPQGDIGPMPLHRWDETKLQFEIEPGKWGAAVDLRGPAGNGERQPFVHFDNPSGGATPRFSYMPMGF